MSADMSIFTLKEVQMQKDPGYRNSSYPESGEEERDWDSISPQPYQYTKKNYIFFLYLNWMFTQNTASEQDGSKLLHIMDIC